MLIDDFSKLITNRGPGINYKVIFSAMCVSANLYNLYVMSEAMCLYDN